MRRQNIVNQISATMRKQFPQAVTDSLYSIELQHGVCISYIVRQPKIWHQHQTPFTVNVAKEGIQL